MFGGVRAGGQYAQSYLTLVIPWTVACQAPLSMIFSRQKLLERLPFPTPGDPPMSLISPVLVGGFFAAATPGKEMDRCTNWLRACP